MKYTRLRLLSIVTASLLLRSAGSAFDPRDIVVRPEPGAAPAGGESRPAAPAGVDLQASVETLRANQNNLPMAESLIRPAGAVSNQPDGRAEAGFVQATDSAGVFTVSENWSTLPSSIRESALAHAEGILKNPNSSADDRAAALALIKLDMKARDGQEFAGGPAGNVSLNIQIDTNGNQPRLTVVAINAVRGSADRTRELPAGSAMALDILNRPEAPATAAGRDAARPLDEERRRTTR